MPRLSRLQQTERNRDLVLAAARRVFLGAGYHGASLDQIADEAGFSKGVVYSQFGSKADLFFALLDARIDERAAANVKLAARYKGRRGVAAMFAAAAQVDGADPAWTRLVIEFRVHAARNPDLNRRYAAAHERTLAGIASVIEAICARGGEKPAFPPRDMAEAMLAMANGTTLERAANPNAIGNRMIATLLERWVSPKSDGEQRT
jgi:AcrR family transcriptional regulator